MTPTPIAILGCGKIAPAYLRNLQGAFARQVRVVACADVVPEAARACAAEFGVPRALSPEALLADPEVEIVLNLTPAPAHYAVSCAVLDAGKHLFTEKPLALTTSEGRDLLRRAAARGRRVAGAADTFLGSGLQACRRLIDGGGIGTPVAATALVGIGLFDSARYHQVFRGALFDLGPYYLTALVALLGPIRRVASCAEIRFPSKTEPAAPGAEPRRFAVDFPTTVAAALEFADGSVASLVASCDLHGYLPRVEIFGIQGSLTLNDANHYGGGPLLRVRGAADRTLDGEPGFGLKGRGLGVAEMALALRAGRPPRADGTLLLHVLEAMEAVHRASRAGPVTLETTVARPEPWDAAELDGG